MQALDMLGELGLPEDLIEDVRGMLGRNAEELDDNNVSPIGDVFGGSEAGGLLTHHSGIAQQHVARAVRQMAAGLRGYRDNLAGFVDDVSETDVSNATALNNLASAHGLRRGAELRDQRLLHAAHDDRPRSSTEAS